MIVYRNTSGDNISSATISSDEKNTAHTTHRTLREFDNSNLRTLKIKSSQWSDSLDLYKELSKNVDTSKKSLGVHQCEQNRQILNDSIIKKIESSQRMQHLKTMKESDSPKWDENTPREKSYSSSKTVATPVR